MALRHTSTTGVVGGFMLRKLVCIYMGFIACALAGLGSDDYALVRTPRLSEELVTVGITSTPMKTLYTQGAVQQVPQTALDKTISSGKNLGIVGTVFHLSGFALNAAFLPKTMNDIRLYWLDDDSLPFPRVGLILALSGGAVSAIGALPSCFGASKVEDAMEDENLRFYRTKAWGLYMRSFAYEAIGWGIWGIGSATMKKASNNTGPIIVMTSLYIFEFIAAVHRTVAVIRPIAYSKKARQHLKKQRSFSLYFAPVLVSNKGIGVAGHLHF